MNIAIIAGHFPARSETFILQHALGLAKRGHHVTVFSQGCGQGISDNEVETCKEHLEVKWAKTHRVTKTSRFLGLVGDILQKKLTAIQKIKAIGVLFKPGLPGRLMTMNHVLPLIGSSFDILHVHFGMFAIPIFQLKDAGLLNGDVVVTWHGVDANVYPRKYGEDIYRELIARQAVHTVGSHFMLHRLEQLGSDGSGVHLVPMGIDLEYFSNIDRDFIAGSALRVVSVGRLAEMKGHIYLIHAIANLIKQDKNVNLTIIGEGPERSTLEDIISQFSLEKKIYLLGAQSTAEVRAIMRKSHIFALTGICAKDGFVETQGVVFAEAQASALPVIGSRVGGVPDSLEEYKTGLLCAPGNVDQIMDAILFFINNPSAVREFGIAGREFIERSFSIEGMIDKFEEIYIMKKNSNI